ncbi:MAG TPA: dual specificity protein phosphatase family protein [Candidatus Binataceae bacterium]|nr:dual specificity protein phosphatase family protein [Candidatus Binataceae bacterium]
MDWFSIRRDAHHSTRGSRRPDVSEISHELLIGEYPQRDDIAWLKETYRIAAVHSLQDEEDLSLHALDLGVLRETYREHGIQFVNTPIQDGSADAMAARLKVALNDLGNLVAASRRVYLHCNAGMNRAPTLAIAFLRAYRQMSLDEALAMVKRRRACGPFMTVLEEYFGPRDYKPPK